MGENTEIKITNLTLGYAVTTPIVTDVEESIKSNQLVALVGNNGVGKTTFLRTFIREIEPLSGAIFIGGKNISKISNEVFSTLVSIVFTGRQSTMGLTVKTVVSLGLHPYQHFLRKASKENEKHVAAMVSLMNIDSLLTKNMEEISDGEYQKVMITRALVQGTPIMLLDEPLAFLDYSSKIDLLKTLKLLVEKTGKLIIFSSHELELLAPIVDSVLAIESGEMHLVNEGIADYLKDTFIRKDKDN